MIALVGIFLLLFCSLLWLTIASRSNVNPRNSPDVLLGSNSFGSPANLPELSDLSTNLSSEDLKFGEEQMARMAKDRPEFARDVSKEDAIWEFCARAFAGATIGERVVWDNSPPQDKGYLSENLGPFKGRPGFIRIRQNYPSSENGGRPLNCEELWSCAVFELENMRGHKAFMALYYRALHGELSREDWIRENTRLEYGALRRTAEDYRRLWKPLTATRSVPNTRGLWGRNIPPTYEGWISLYRDPNSYPWDAFGDYYDRQIVPYVKDSKRFQGIAR